MSRQRLRTRVTTVVFRLTERLRLGAATAYLAAASLIGFEALVALLSLSSLWPASVPFVVGALALAYRFRERLRAWWGWWRR
ncbi:hypothetical protein [Phytomonospora endophytica]|uniref:Uncharacterized protein n=1 Tax=Phytomonospora endophytica TaxID=714109 RepID=A0A841FRI8_9ACTN|nr:hypothetical protein [Phytomonospora endophytica]MBB6036162.1 hypothetical protein [Phytomonospora endophytica]GIG67066.1 hypothetical protein Pen01_33610 [Phytomonospora endophytica]